jgi:sulfur-oxidizing protein SoxX
MLVPLVAVFGIVGGRADTQALVPFKVRGDSISAPLAGLKGDPARGRALFLSRESNCSLCHLLPDGDPRLMGDVGPQLAGIGTRLTAGELRLRIVDSSRVHPDTAMPSYYRVDGLDRVASAYAGKPVLTPQEIEDLVAFLSTLR